MHRTYHSNEEQQILLKQHKEEITSDPLPTLSLIQTLVKELKLSYQSQSLVNNISYRSEDAQPSLIFDNLEDSGCFHEKEKLSQSPHSQHEQSRMKILEESSTRNKLQNQNSSFPKKTNKILLQSKGKLVYPHKFSNAYQLVRTARPLH